MSFACNKVVVRTKNAKFGCPAVISFSYWYSMTKFRKHSSHYNWSWNSSCAIVHNKSLKKYYAKRIPNIMRWYIMQSAQKILQTYDGLFLLPMVNFNVFCTVVIIFMTNNISTQYLNHKQSSWRIRKAHNSNTLKIFWVLQFFFHLKEFQISDSIQPWNRNIDK